MVSRAAHYESKRRHAQRTFGEQKPKLVDKDEATAWIGPFVSSIQGLTEPINVNSLIVLQLGADARERELRLRELSKLGVLHMFAHRKAGEFVEYRWELS